MRERRSEILCRSPYHLINSHDAVIIQVIGATGQLPDFIFDNSMDLCRIVTDFELISNPKKAKPSLNVVTCDFRGHSFSSR